MGDSSVSCALSGLTLYIEPVVFLPLVRAKYADKVVGARLIASGSQSCGLFSPLTLPYRGQLDSYGRLESVVEDENTAYIESVFDMPIKDFTEACTFGEEINIHGELSEVETVPGVGCFIHADVYDRFSKPVVGGKYAASVWAAQFAGRRHLEVIGCEFIRDTGEGRYRYIYKHPAIPGISFHSDGEFSHIVVDATGKQPYAFGLDDMQRALRRHGFNLFPKEDVARAKATSDLQMIFQQEAQSFINKLGEETEINRKIKRTEIVDLHLFHLQRSSYLRMLESFDTHLLNTYIMQFAGGRLLDRIEELVYLLWSFSYANRLLMPTAVGTQYPEHEITSVITGFIDRIAKDRIRNNYR